MPDRSPLLASSRTLVMGLVLAVAVAATYAGTLSNGFVWDDHDLVVDNPETHDLANVGRVLLSPDLTPPYYRPLPRALLLLEYALFGPLPWAFHLVSVVVHLGAAWCLFGWARRLFGREVPALVAALAWAVHPVGAEAVGFVSVRTAPLAALFMFATLWAVQRMAEREDGRGRWLPGLLFLLALGCKEQAVMALPLAVVVVRLRVSSRTSAAPSTMALLAPMGGALVLYLVARVVALGGPLGDVPAVVGRHQAMGVVDALVAAGRYVTLFAWPSGLTVTHDLARVSMGPTLMGLVAVLGLTGWAWRRRTAPAVLGAAWFWLTLLPTLQVMALPSALFAERHAYLLYPGLALLVVDLGLAAHERWPSRRVASSLVVAALAACTALGLRTVERHPDWHDNRALFESALAVGPSALAHLNLGNLDQAEGHLVAAEEHWRAAVALDPRDADALNQLGVLAARSTRLIEARDWFRRALEAFPAHPVARENLKKVESMLPGRP